MRRVRSPASGRASGRASGATLRGCVSPPTTRPSCFRLSQTTDDLFDAYRNAYLALESVLSSIAPQLTNPSGKVTEREGDWFKRALMEADKIVPLASVVPSGTADPARCLFDELYVNMRSAMSHAKSGRRVLLPQDESERRAVTDSLRVLVELFLKLAGAHFGARRSGGGMFAGGFRLMFGPSLDQMKLYVSDDESSFNATDSVPNPAGGLMRELTAAAPVESPRPFVN